MQFKDYVKDRITTIALLLFAIIQIQVILLIYPITILIRLYFFIIPLIGYFLGIYFEYRKKKNFYDETLGKLNNLDEKYLIAEMIEAPSSIEEKILESILHETDKSMIEKINQYKYVQEEYKDYIELWIHEIKLPIATSKMIIENNPSPITLSIDEELNEIENYIEQALYYARSEIANNDYYIRKCNLKDIVNEVIKKNKKSLIAKKIRIETNNIEKIIYTDLKWSQFILNQIIQNSIKYKKELDSAIICEAEEKKENVILKIIDNGIGIKTSELPKVFDKGFTGTNGRIEKKSTGIGLFLCKKLCNKLGMGIEINSTENEGTEVKIIFPKNSFIEM